MARAHEVAIGADGRDFNRAIKDDVIKPVGDAARSLDELGADGERDLGKLEAALKDVQNQADKTETAARDVGDKGFDRAGESTKAFKQEAVANFSEVASSFSGDITEMADGVQGLTGGLASALTPGVGIPIAILGALAGAFLNSWITAADDSEQRVEDMFTAMTEAGSRFLSESQIKEAIEGLDTEKIAEGMQRAHDISIDEGAVLRAMVGDVEAINAIQDELTSRKQDELDKIRDSGASLEDQKTKADAVNTAYGEQQQWLIDIQKDTDTAGKKWDAVKKAINFAGGEVSTIQEKVAGLALGTTVPITFTVDESNLIAAQNRADAWARSGLKVAVTGTLSGRTWE